MPPSKGSPRSEGCPPVLTLLPVLFSGMLACSESSSTPDAGKTVEAVESDWGGVHATQSGKYRVTVRSEPDPPEMGEFFTLEATITREDGTPVERAQVDLDARMPQHNHGMMTDPVMQPGDCEAVPDDDPTPKRCVHEGGVYRADGFKFHMGGEWTILIDVQGPIGPDRTTFVYDMR